MTTNQETPVSELTTYHATCTGDGDRCTEKFEAASIQEAWDLAVDWAEDGHHTDVETWLRDQPILGPHGSLRHHGHWIEDVRVTIRVEDDDDELEDTINLTYEPQCRTIYHDGSFRSHDRGHEWRGDRCRMCSITREITEGHGPNQNLAQIRYTEAVNPAPSPPLRRGRRRVEVTITEVDGPGRWTTRVLAHSRASAHSRAIFKIFRGCMITGDPVRVEDVLVETAYRGGWRPGPRVRVESDTDLA